MRWRRRRLHGGDTAAKRQADGGRLGQRLGGHRREPGRYGGDTSAYRKALERYVTRMYREQGAWTACEPRSGSAPP